MIKNYLIKLQVSQVISKWDNTIAIHQSMLMKMLFYRKQHQLLEGPTISTINFIIPFSLHYV